MVTFLLRSETVMCTFLFCFSSTFIHPWFLAVCVADITHRNNLFHLYKQNKGKGKRENSYRLAIVAKGLLKLSNLPMLIKQKKLITLHRLWFLANLLIVFSTKVNLIYLFHLIGLLDIIR